jgi:hypothetical protein
VQAMPFRTPSNSPLSAAQQKMRQNLLSMTPMQIKMRELQLERELWKRECRSNLTAWCIEALRSVGQRPVRHHLFMLDELKRVVRGETQRLMIFMPPNHAKTTYSTVLFPPWFMAQKPNWSMPVPFPREIVRYSVCAPDRGYTKPEARACRAASFNDRVPVA